MSHSVRTQFSEKYQKCLFLCQPVGGVCVGICVRLALAGRLSESWFEKKRQCNQSAVTTFHGQCVVSNGMQDLEPYQHLTRPT